MADDLSKNPSGSDLAPLVQQPPQLPPTPQPLPTPVLNPVFRSPYPSPPTGVDHANQFDGRGNVPQNRIAPLTPLYAQGTNTVNTSAGVVNQIVRVINSGGSAPAQVTMGGDVNGVSNNCEVVALRNTTIMNQAPLDGQILIYDLATNNYVPGDPIVSGPDAPGVLPTRNPVQIGGVDQNTGFVTRIITDSSGAVIVSAASGSDFSVNVDKWGGVTTTLGQKVMASSAPVVIASDQSAIPITQSTSPWVDNITQWASTVLGTPQTFGSAPTGVVIGTSSDIYVAGTRARSNQTTTAAGVQDVNLVGALGVTMSVTNPIFSAITDGTTKAGVIAATTALKTDVSSVAGTAVVSNGISGLLPTGNYGTGSTSDAAWTSGTALNTAVTLVSNISGYSSIAVTLNQAPSGTLTGGAVTFEFSNDNSNWYPTVGVDPQTAEIVGPIYTLVLATYSIFLFSVEAPYFRVRLSTAITGSGTVTVGHAVSSLPRVHNFAGNILLTASLNAAYNSTLPTLSNGQTSVVQLDQKGQLLTDLNYWAGTALGSPTNFGTTPTAVKAGSVNASIFIGATAPAANNALNTLPGDGTSAMGTMANFGTSPTAVKALVANASVFAGTTGITATGTSLNANVTNTVTISGAVTVTSGAITVSQSTASSLKAQVVGTLTNNNAVPAATNIGVLPALCNTSAPTFTDGDQTLLSVDTSGSLRVTGGTQFADNAASGSTPTGTLSMGWDSANSKVRALKVDASQNLNVNLAANSFGTVTVTGTVATTQSTSPWVVSLTSTTITGTVAVTQSTSPWVTQDKASAAVGATGTGTAAGFAVNVAGLYNSVTNTAPTSAQQCELQVDQTGNLLTFSGMQYKVGTLWNSATSLNTLQYSTGTATSGQLLGSPALIVQVQPNGGTFSAGAVTFQGTYDNNLWVTIPVTQVLNPQTYAQLTNPYTFISATVTPFLLLTQGFIAIRANLTTAITGTGNVIIYWSTLPYAPVVPASANITQINGNAVSTAASGVQKVGIVGNAAATLDATVAAGSAPTNALATLTQYKSTIPALTDTQTIARQGDTTGAQYINTEGRKKTFSCSASFSAAVGVIAYLPGNATNTVRLTRVEVSLSTTGTAGFETISLIVTSAAPSGGSPTSMTAVPHDSAFAAAVSAPASYTAAPTGGTPVGTIRAVQFADSSSTVLGSNTWLWDWTMRAASAPVLRGTAQTIEINISGVIATTTATVSYEWTEE